MSAHPRNRTRLSPEVRREQIVDAAVRVFDGRDPAEVTFEQVAEAAGVSRGLVYNYFGDKQGLIAAVYLRTLQHLDAALSADLRGDEPPEELLRGVVSGYLRFAKAHAHGFGYLVGNAAATLHPEVRAARLERVRRVAERWAGQDPDALLVGHAVVGLLESVTVEWLTAGREDVERTAELVADLLWSGLSGLEQLQLASVTAN